MKEVHIQLFVKPDKMLSDVTSCDHNNWSMPAYMMYFAVQILSILAMAYVCSKQLSRMCNHLSIHTVAYCRYGCYGL